MPWIDHPATAGQGPVSLYRWIKYKVGVWLSDLGRRWEDEGLYPDRCPECGQRKPRFGECDHIPF